MNKQNIINNVLSVTLLVSAVGGRAVTAEDGNTHTPTNVIVPAAQVVSSADISTSQLADALYSTLSKADAFLTNNLPITSSVTANAILTYWQSYLMRAIKYSAELIEPVEQLLKKSPNLSAEEVETLQSVSRATRARSYSHVFLDPAFSPFGISPVEFPQINRLTKIQTSLRVRLIDICTAAGQARLRYLTSSHNYKLIVEKAKRAVELNDAAGGVDEEEKSFKLPPLWGENSGVTDERSVSHRLHRRKKQ